MAIATPSRKTADERREAVLDAATHEFAQRGYHAASTASIAKLAGISQPYIYALFPNKRDLFLGVQARCAEHLRAAFADAVRGVEGPQERLDAMGHAYRPLIEADRDELLVQMQGHAAAGDPEIGPAVAAHFKALYEEILRTSGATREEVSAFFACGMLVNVATALQLPELIEPLLIDKS